jgi:hypothetical protein
MLAFNELKLPAVVDRLFWNQEDKDTREVVRELRWAFGSGCEHENARNLSKVFSHALGKMHDHQIA